jgi:phosphoglycolate phosphatase
MLIRAVVFDLDGTLLDSLADIANACNAVLAAHALPTYPIDAYRYMVGDGVRRLITRAVPNGNVPDATDLEPWIAQFLVHYERAWNVESRLYDGIPELLRELTDRAISMSVLSNKPQEATMRCVRHFLAEFPFAAVLGQDVGRPPKPDLTGVREILEKLKVDPSACLYLGDTGVDMLTARGAGMMAVGATWGFRDAEELRSAGADVILDHPLELLSLLKPP